MLSLLFLGFVVLMVAVVIALSARYLGRRVGFMVAAGLAAWSVYLGLMGYLGVFANTSMRPPGVLFLFGPVVAFLVFSIIRLQTPGGARVALAFPLWVLLGTQCFRVGVELFLHRLWRDGLIPQMLTFSGANVDIYIGATAPIVVWLVTHDPAGRRYAIIWNILGLLALANVVIRAVLTAPGPLHLLQTEVPNLMIGTFPFMFIAGFFVPLAVLLHALALRALLRPVETSARS